MEKSDPTGTEPKPDCHSIFNLGRGRVPEKLLAGVILVGEEAL